MRRGGIPTLKRPEPMDPNDIPTFPGRPTAPPPPKPAEPGAVAPKIMNVFRPRASTSIPQTRAQTSSEKPSIPLSTHVPPKGAKKDDDKFRIQQAAMFEQFQREKREKELQESQLSPEEKDRLEQERGDAKFRRKQAERLAMFAPRLAAKISVPVKRFDEEWGPYLDGQIDFEKSSFPKSLTLLSDGQVGMWRGIQGEKNSCYIDSTLFACFAFENVFDLLLKKITSKSAQKFQDHLRGKIVSPLRARAYVNSKDVMEWRVLLNRWLPGNDYHDPEPLQEGVPVEFLRVLFQQLDAPHYLHYCRLNVEADKGQKKVVQRDSSWIYDLFADEIDDDFPTVQNLLEKSFVDGGIRLIRRPEVMIIQLPRWGAETKAFPRVFPDLKLDLSPVMLTTAMDKGEADSSKPVDWMKASRDYEAEAPDDMRHFLDSMHRLGLNQRKLSIDESAPIVPEDIENEAEIGGCMELFGVLVIGTSHFCSYTRYSRDMYFFDSMADRVGLDDGENVPQITRVPHLVEYLSEPDDRHDIDSWHGNTRPTLPADATAEQLRAASGTADEAGRIDLTKRLINDACVLLYRKI